MSTKPIGTEPPEIQTVEKKIQTSLSPSTGRKKQLRGGFLWDSDANNQDEEQVLFDDSFEDLNSHENTGSPKQSRSMHSLKAYPQHRKTHRNLSVLSSSSLPIQNNNNNNIIKNRNSSPDITQSLKQGEAQEMFASFPTAPTSNDSLGSDKKPDLPSSDAHPKPHLQPKPQWRATINPEQYAKKASVPNLILPLDSSYLVSSSDEPPPLPPSNADTPLSQSLEENLFLDHSPRSFQGNSTALQVSKEIEEFRKRKLKDYFGNSYRDLMAHAAVNYSKDTRDKLEELFGEHPDQYMDEQGKKIKEGKEKPNKNILQKFFVNIITRKPSKEKSLQRELSKSKEFSNNISSSREDSPKEKHPKEHDSKKFFAFLPKKGLTKKTSVNPEALSPMHSRKASDPKKDTLPSINQVGRQSLNSSMPEKSITGILEPKSTEETTRSPRSNTLVPPPSSEPRLSPRITLSPTPEELRKRPPLASSSPIVLYSPPISRNRSYDSSHQRSSSLDEFRPDDSSQEISTSQEMIRIGRYVATPGSEIETALLEFLEQLNSTVEKPKYGVCFGVMRGSCKFPCECICYSPTGELGGTCKTCGHVAAKHENLGRVNEDSRKKPLTITNFTKPSPLASKTSKQLKHEIEIIRKKRSTSHYEMPKNSPPTKNRPKRSISDTVQSNSHPPSVVVFNSPPLTSSEGNSMIESPRTDDDISFLNSGLKKKPSSMHNHPYSSPRESGHSDSLLPLIGKLMEKGANWIINAKDLKFTSKLGTGTHAKVFKGLYRGQEVALKIPKIPEGRIAEEFLKEFEILSSVRSQNVVYFYGVVFVPKFCIIMEFCAKGTLQDVLKNDKEPFGWDRFLRIAIDATRGIVDLHNWEPLIVHRDLKSLNLLIDENDKCKITDFGLARFLQGSSQGSLNKVRGTYAYCAPELYFNEEYTPYADIYSMSIILWEMAYRVLSGMYQVPFREYKFILHDFQIITQTAVEKLRPTIPQKCPVEIPQSFNR